LATDELAHRRDAREQPVVAQAPLHGQGPRAGGGMADIGVAVLERAAAGADSVVDVLANHQSADRLVARAESLGNRDHVRDDAFALERPVRSAVSDAAHHLVEDAQETAAPPEPSR